MSTVIGKDNIRKELKTYIEIGLTGHRPTKLGGYDITTPPYIRLQRDLEDVIETHLKKYVIVKCRSGLALGADTVWSKAILAMRDKYPNRVLFHADIPMMSQSSVWFKQSDIDFWQYQVENCDSKTVYGDLMEYPEAQRAKMSGVLLNKRNEGMLDPLQLLLAIWDGSTSGTGNAVAYAEKIGLIVKAVHPGIYFK